MKNTVVIYKSKYGSTKKYAQWISQELHCDMLENKNLKPEVISQYDTIVYGGGLYGGTINGIRFLVKNFPQLKNKKVIIYTVGLADPQEKEQFQPILQRNFSQEMQEHFHIFHLRGAIDYKKLTFVHKRMMELLIKLLRKKKECDLTLDDKQMLETYGQVVDFCNQDTIKPLLEIAKATE